MPLPENVELDTFFDTIYGSEDGIIYLALKSVDGVSQFKQEFFKWPEQRTEFFERAISAKGTNEVYFGPALYASSEAKKQNVKGSSVVWAEFDGNTPTNFGGLPAPSVIVRSSDETHTHCYWRLDNFTEPGIVESINRKITYLLNADSSGWDITQILRVPGTLNHKRQREVKLISLSDSKVSPLVFDSISEPPPLVDIQVPEKIPQVNDVIAKYPWKQVEWNLFKNGLPVGQRSSGLMALGYYCAEKGLTNEEMLAVLLNADERWGKFAKRSDQVKRLLEIVTRAKQKYPSAVTQEKPEEENLSSLGLQTLLATNIKLEWIWEGFLQKNGYLLLTGQAGIGKTQFALDLGAKIALGKPFLNKFTRQGKIGFFSLEMGLVDLKHFLLAQASSYKPTELEQLEKNLRFFALGEPLYLNRQQEKDRIEAVVAEENLSGIIVDSLGSTTEGELSDEKDVKNLFDWNDRLRQEYGIFTLFVHHHRKAQGENKKPNKLSDIYGSQYITARATTVLTLWDTGVPNTLDVLPLKVRLSERPPRFSIIRDTTLKFKIKASSGIVKQAQQADASKQDEPEPKQEEVKEMSAADETAGTNEVGLDL